jgi:tetratricopeptide (TPR) repeat protein
MSKPSVTKSNHLLPFDKLSPEQFEILCLWLVDREGYLRAEHLGAAGSEQGRDVIAYRAADGGEQLWYFQCKRYQKISAATLIEEAEKYNRLAASDPTKRPFGIIFVTNAVLSVDAREKVRTFCGRHGYNCEFWARTELDLRVKRHADVVAEFFNLPPSPPPPRDRISISRLPVTGPDLFGRDAELRLLDDAWADRDTNVVTFVAWGGVGKTALVNHWLKRRMALGNYRGAERVFAWSFYSQGTSPRDASADLFIDQALRWFGDEGRTQGSPWRKGERLARLIRQTRTLLVLDGLEPLQHPPGPQEGRLKDAALQTLLVELAAEQPGLCVITTRERVSDLVEFGNGTVVQHNLEKLSPQAGARLLRALGVTGGDDEMEQAAGEYDGHALALTLLGGYLADACDGDVQRRGEIGGLEEDVRHGRHAERVMRAYEKWLGDGTELSVLRLMGLFNRPAEAASVAALRAAPAIPGLTDALQNLREREWQRALAKLRRLKMLITTYSRVSAVGQDVLDAHPLVREHFKQQLKREHPDAWREANNRLYEHLTRAAEEFPNTVEGMAPLFAAVAHGCAAGRHQETFDAVYKRRVQRGDEYFDLYKLNAFGADLEALISFFDPQEQQPSAALTEDSRTEILSIRGYDLRALGRLKEAAEQMRLALALRVKQKKWKDAAINAGNLSRIYLIIGDLEYALQFSKQGVELADQSGDVHEQMGRRAILADVLHHAGRWGEAEATFREAEAFQTRRTPKRLILDSLAGFWYCDFLLGQGKYQEVIDRSGRTIEIAREKGWPIDVAMDNLSLARAHFALMRSDGTENASPVTALLEEAVEGLRQAGTIDYLPLGLLARAEVCRVQGDYGTAERDLAEVLRISTRSGMNLYLADYHLGMARIHMAQGSSDKAYESWATAKTMVEGIGYRRRVDDITEIARRLS